MGFVTKTISTLHMCVKQARIRAYDGGFPSRSATATVRISVLRNLFSPVYNHTGSIQRTILETDAVGTFIFDLEAYDNDRQVKYLLT